MILKEPILRKHLENINREFHNVNALVKQISQLYSLFEHGQIFTRLRFWSQIHVHVQD